MNNYGFPPFSFSPVLPGEFPELSEAPEENLLSGPFRRSRGQGMSVEERTRRLQEKARQFLDAFGVADQEELNRVFHSISTGCDFDQIQNYELRRKVEHWFNWEQ